MRQVAGKLRLDMAQYAELATFAQFGASDLDKATLAQLERGKRMIEILKQPQYAPISLENEVMILFAVTNGFIDDVPVEKVSAFENAFYKFMSTNHPEVGTTIASEKLLKPETEAALKKAIAEFKQGAAY
jgi:F-type H+/Na+-transporting ATPase subunit alpha